MNNVQHVSITKGGQQVFQFVVYDNFEHAAYLAGQIGDRLTDYHGGDDWDWQVTAAPYVSSMTPDLEILRLALSKVSF